jgi:hypothetical protein
MRGVLFLALTLVTATFAPLVGPGMALAADKAANNQLELQARQEFAAGRYDKALELFAKLYAETLHPVYLRNIGRCHQKMREPQKAIDAFKDYLAKSPKTGKDKVTAEERTEIDGYIKEMEALRDEQARAAQPVQPVQPIQPVQPVQPVNTGTTTSPVLTAPQPAQTVTTPTAPPPESHPIYTRWWFWTGIGVVAAAAITTAVVLSSGGKPDCPSDVTCPN